MYWQLSFMSFKRGFVYRIHFIITILSSIIQLAVLWFLWTAIYSVSSTEIIGGFTFTAMITYASISTAISFIISSYTEYAIEEDVKTGRISNTLTKPVNYIVFYIFNEYGEVFFKILTMGLPLILISFLFLNISLPSSSIFFISVIFGFFINFFLVLLTGMWAFWTAGSIWGIRLTRYVVSQIMSGAIIPIYLFPEWLKTIAYILPFQAIFNIPLSIYIGKIVGYEILSAIGIQLLWFFGLALMCVAVWKQAEKKIMVHGG